MNELKPGSSLQDGKYVIKRVLGQGGFGITYLAEQVMLEREVAVKEFFMKDNCLRDDETGMVSVPSTGSAIQVERYRAKFLKEAKTLASLDHAHIVEVFDVFEQNGTVYYVMLYLNGGSLSDLVKAQGRLPEDTAMRYIHQIATALKYMHNEKHVCHYDIKPANILLDSKGNAILIDFGISKNYDSNGNETSSTPIGMSVGYAPIEQYQQLVNEFSPASDVYALGATLYYLVTGKTPPTAVSRVAGEDLDLGGELSPSLRQLIESAMTIGVKNRPQDVDVFLNYVVREVPSQDPIHTETPSEETVVPQGIPQQPSPDRGLLNKPKESFTVMGVTFTMVHVEGGTFTMGETKEQGYSIDGLNRPIHKVTVSSFYLCNYPVTQELWQAVMGSNPSHFRGEVKHPVESVTWGDCQDFIKRLNALTGKAFRLPTEAEWEFAARGGNKSKGYRFAGSDSCDDVAWYVGNSGEKAWYGQKNKGTKPVGLKMPNELGLFDMSGNVYEWCQDWYDDYSPKEQNNPTGPKEGEFKIYRGGSWKSEKFLCKNSSRQSDFPSRFDYIIGFRLAL